MFPRALLPPRGLFAGEVVGLDVRLPEIADGALVLRARHALFVRALSHLAFVDVELLSGVGYRDRAERTALDLPVSQSEHGNQRIPAPLDSARQFFFPHALPAFFAHRLAAAALPISDRRRFERFFALAL